MKKALKLGFNLAVAGATTALSISLVGNLGILVGGAFAGGGAIGNIIKRKPLIDTVNEALTVYSAVNAVIHPLVWLGDVTFPLIPNETILGKIARGVYASTAYNAVFLGGYRGATHLIDNYFNPIGITKSIKDNFYNWYQRIGLGFSPWYALDANGIKTLFGLPTFAVGAPIVGFYNAVKPVKTEKTEFQWMNPFYLANRATSGARKIYREAATAVSDIGAAVRGAAQTPQPKPA